MKKQKDTKMGRPKKAIKKSTFESLCNIQCTEDEICAVLGISKSTLLVWCKDTYDGQTFQDIYKKLASYGKASLRRTQWNMAQDNYKMAIWLGKQYLGQRDNVEVSANGEQLEKLDGILRAVEQTAAQAAKQAQKQGEDGENGDE